MKFINTASVLTTKRAFDYLNQVVHGASPKTVLCRKKLNPEKPRNTYIWFNPLIKTLLRDIF